MLVVVQELRTRRDGFAALVTDNVGRIVTPLVCFEGEGLWVNAQCKSLKAELRDINNRPIKGLTFNDCVCRNIDSTKQQII